MTIQKPLERMRTHNGIIVARLGALPRVREKMMMVYLIGWAAESGQLHVGICAAMGGEVGTHFSLSSSWLLRCHICMQTSAAAFLVTGDDATMIAPSPPPAFSGG